MDLLKLLKIKTDKNQNRNYKMMSFHRDNDKLLEKYKSIWTKVEDLKNIEWEHMGISMKNSSLFSGNVAKPIVADLLSFYFKQKLWLDVCLLVKYIDKKI